MARPRTRDLVTGGIWLTAALIAFAIIAPALWALTASLKPPAELLRFPPQWLPRSVTFHAYADVWSLVPLARWIENSVVITFLGTFGNLVSCTLVGYGFARFRFPYRDALFMVVLSTLMLPKIVTLIPIFLMFKRLGWVDTFLPLIVPQWVAAGGESGLYIFIARQFFRTIPMALSEAAHIDGCSELMVFARVILPLAKPPLATVVLLSIVWNWGDFLTPLVFINSQEKFPIALGLQLFKDDMLGSTKLMSELLAVTIISIVPIVVLFFLAERYFVTGSITTGLRG